LHELMCAPPPSKDHTYSFAEWLVTEAQQAAVAIECDVESPVDEVYDFGEIYCDSDVSSSESVSDVDSRSSGLPEHRRAISRHSWMQPDHDDDEERRLEGVRALLNLASGPKLGMARKSRRLTVNGSLWVKAVNTRLKKQTKRLGKVRRKKLKKSKVKSRKKVVRKRTR